MNSKQIKKKLLDLDLTPAKMARTLCLPGRSIEATRQMISQMIHGRRFYPTLAKRIEHKYGLRLER